MKKTIFNVGCVTGAVLLLLGSCSDDAFLNEAINVASEGKVEAVKLRSMANESEIEKYLVQFAEVLSKATYERKDVREFLKKESVKQFDKNYDVLYELVKDEEINGETLRDILVSYSSEDAIREIETNVPLLNILVPKIACFKIEPEKLDVEDKEIPVAVSKKSETSLYLDGKREINLKKGEIPRFHVFVVNENSRVVAVNGSNNTPMQSSMRGRRARSFTGTNRKSVVFKSPNFDGSIPESITLRSESVGGHIVGSKAIEAFNYYYADDGSVNQKSLQRDYIYYGITPQKTSGSLNRSVSEYIAFIEINPKAYFKISDQRLNTPNDDPRISEDYIKNERAPLSEEELLDKMWTKGAYDFRFEIETSTSQHPHVIHIPLRPDEIWDFHIDYEYIHHTWFRHSKHIYRIDPKKFTSKKVLLTPEKISFGKWNIAEEALYRTVRIYEEDDEGMRTQEFDYESIHMFTNKFKGDVKIGLGLTSSNVNISGGAETEVTQSNTFKRKSKIVISRNEKSDGLGDAKIYFYDPIVENVRAFFPSYWIAEVHTYNTGYVKFALAVQ